MPYKKIETLEADLKKGAGGNGQILKELMTKLAMSNYKKQEKARQIEAIIRYLDTVDEIDNEAARKLLNIPDTNASYVSRLFAEMLDKGHIQVAEEIKHNQRTDKLKNTFIIKTLTYFCLQLCLDM